MTIVVYEPTNEGGYGLVERSTTDEQLIKMWCNRPRKAQSANTYDTYCRIGNKFMTDVGKPLQAVTYTDLAEWVNNLTGSINTQRLTVNVVRSLFSFAHELGYIRLNPALMVEPPTAEETKHRKMLSEEEVIGLVRSGLSARDEAIVRVLYSSGMRVSELCALRWQDVIATGDKAVLVIRGKGGKTRESGISPSAYRAMLNVRAAFTDPTEPVFTSNRNRAMSRDSVHHIFETLSKKIGKDISPHWMRHSHVSHALARGANPVDVQEQVGHSSLQVTTGYAHKTKSSSDYLII